MGKKIEIGSSKSKEIEKIIKDQKSSYKKCAEGLVMKKPGRNIKKSKVEINNTPLFDCINNYVKIYNGVINPLLEECSKLIQENKTFSDVVINSLKNKNIIPAWKSLVLLQNNQLNSDESPSYYPKLQENLTALKGLGIELASEPRSAYASKCIDELKALDIDLKTLILKPLNEKFIKSMKGHEAKLNPLIAKKPFTIFNPENIYTLLVVKAKLSTEESETVAGAIATAYEKLPKKLEKLKQTLATKAQKATETRNNSVKRRDSLVQLATNFKGYLKEKAKEKKKSKQSTEDN